MVKPQGQGQNADRQKTFQQCEGQVPPAPEEVVSLKNMKLQNGKRLSLRRQVPMVKPRMQGQNVYRQKHAQQCEGQVPPDSSHVVNFKSLQVQNGKQLSLGRQVSRVNPRRQGQNADQQKTAQQCESQDSPVPLKVVNQLKNLKVQNSWQLPPGHQVPRNKSQQCEVHDPLLPPKVVNEPENLKVQNGNQIPPGKQVPRNKSGSRCQNLDQQKNVPRQGQATPVHSQVVHPKNFKVENGEQLSPGSQVPRIKPGIPYQNEDQRKTAQQCQGQVLPLPLKVVSPPWPHTLQPRANDNVASHPSFASPIAQA